MPKPLTICSLAVIAVLVAGCPGPNEPPLCSEFSNDEIGEDDCPELDGTGEPGPLEPEECIYAEDPDRDGYRVQCEGEFHTRIDFKALTMNCVEAVNEEFCFQVYPFGPPHDTYEAPDVMACCGEAWDPVEHLDVYQDPCMKDLAAQACASIAKRMEKAIEAGDFKTKLADFTEEATNLQKYVESHLEECTVALYNDHGNSPDPSQLVSQWEIPNVKGKDGWWPATNIVVYVEAGTSVVDAHRPEDQADWIECHGAFDNDDEIFEDQASPDGDVFVAVDLDSNVVGRLAGPVIGGGITAMATFATHCIDQGCPNAAWSYDMGTEPDFTLEEFELYATNFDTTNGISSTTIERARVELWTQAQGTKVLAAGASVLGYRVPPGQAWFYVAGVANGVSSRHMAVNTTDIEIVGDRGAWTILPFDIESTDFEDRTWTLTLGESRWQR